MPNSIIGQQNVKVREAIRKAIVAAGLVEDESLIPELVLEVPKDKAHGDLATNVAMQLTKLAKKNPRQLAEALLAALVFEGTGIVSAEIAGPGFINFRLDQSFLHAVLGDVQAKGTAYGRTDDGVGTKLQMEFVSANPTGSLHLGHARGAAYGDALANILAFAGYDVAREYYINDAGNQVNNLGLSLEARYKQQLGMQAELPEDGYHGPDLIDIAKQLVAEQGDSVLHFPQEEQQQYYREYGLQAELAKIKRDLANYRVEFDSWFSETSLYTDGLVEQALGALQDRGQVYEEEGAIWLDTMRYGDDKNRVLKKSDGSYTYLTPDIAYHRTKFERGYDRLINIWGADHHGYIPRVKAAMEGLGFDSSKLTVVLAQMVRLMKDGDVVKMSKRTGNAVTIEELMDEVGVDAMRYFFASRSSDSQLDFDMDLAVSTSNDNPVHYVKYAHARICSVLRQAKEQGIDASAAALQAADLSPLSSEADYELLRKIGEFPAEISEAARLLAPHRIVRYVYDLAAQLHSYYFANKVITDDKALTRARLALFAGTRTTLANGLRLIGVSAPERM